MEKPQWLRLQRAQLYKTWLMAFKWVSCLWSPRGFSVQFRRKQFWATGSSRYFKPGAEHRMICFGRWIFFSYLASIFGREAVFFSCIKEPVFSIPGMRFSGWNGWGKWAVILHWSLSRGFWISLDCLPPQRPLSPRDCPQYHRGSPRISLDVEFYSCFRELLTPPQGWIMNGSLPYASFTLCTFIRILSAVNVPVYSYTCSSLQPKHSVLFMSLSLSSRGISCSIKFPWLCTWSYQSLLCHCGILLQWCPLPFPLPQSASASGSGHSVHRLHTCKAPWYSNCIHNSLHLMSSYCFVYSFSVGVCSQTTS